MKSRLDTVTYSVFKAADTGDTGRVLGVAFAQRDPPAVAMGLTDSEFEAFVRLYCPKADLEGLTIVARSATTGEMIGALLAEDSVSPLPDGMDRLSAKFKPIFDILGQLDSEYRQGVSMQFGQCVHLFLLGVAGSFGGHGVAQRLVAEGLANAERKGYTHAITEATNTTSQHVFRKQGFVERVRRSYADHRFEGRAFFGSIAEHGGPLLMDRPLAP